MVSTNQPLAQAQHGHEDEESARNEDRGQGGLPAVAQRLADGKRDKGVLAHVRRNRERTIGIQRHQQAPENGGQHSRHKTRPDRNTRIRQNRRIHHHDIRHRGEGGEPGNHLPHGRGVMFPEPEDRHAGKFSTTPAKAFHRKGRNGRKGKAKENIGR
jgi:hypothetical protein